MENMVTAMDNGLRAQITSQIALDLEAIEKQLAALTEEFRIANFFYILRFFNDEETNEISEEFKKICETSGKFWSAPEVAKRFCDCVKTAIAN